MAKHGLAVDRRHFPVSKHAERERNRPAHRGGDLAGGADRQRANVLLFDWKRERPLLPEHRELLGGFGNAAISLDPILRRHASFPLREATTLKPGRPRCQSPARACLDRARAPTRAFTASCKSSAASGIIWFLIRELCRKRGVTSSE
jgi:hypothetical protein